VGLSDRPAGVDTTCRHDIRSRITRSHSSVVSRSDSMSMRSS
jgi:hypothetical protein